MRVLASLLRLPALLGLALIRAYQLILAPWLGPSCRYEPSCSRYTASCIGAHGLFLGAALGLRRICRCHPFAAGGYDPPPLGPLTAPRRQLRAPQGGGSAP